LAQEVEAPMQAQGTRAAAHLVGIEVRHRKGCPNTGERASSCRRCVLKFRAKVHIGGGKYERSEWTDSLATARGQRTKLNGSILDGDLTPATTPDSVSAVMERFLEGVADGSILARSGKPYKPSMVRGFRSAWNAHLDERIGDRRLAKLSRGDVQGVIDTLREGTLDASTIHNAIKPLRAMCRWALRRNLIATNPTTDLELPAIEGKRVEKVATRAQVDAMLAPLPIFERAVMATAAFSGLRRGEIRGLSPEDVDLDAERFYVTKAQDQIESEAIRPKSKRSVREVPIAPKLKAILSEYLASNGTGQAFFFAMNGRRGVERPFDADTVLDGCRAIWGDDMTGATLHDLRHFCCSCLGEIVGVGKLSKYDAAEWMGHDPAVFESIYVHTGVNGRPKETALHAIFA
jgi:integrase